MNAIVTSQPILRLFLLANVPVVDQKGTTTAMPLSYATVVGEALAHMPCTNTNNGVNAWCNLNAIVTSHLMLHLFLLASATVVGQKDTTTADEDQQRQKHQQRLKKHQSDKLCVV